MPGLVFLVLIEAVLNGLTAVLHQDFRYVRYVRYDSGQKEIISEIWQPMCVNREPGVHTVRQLKLKKIAAATALALSSAGLLSPAFAAGLGRLTVTSGLGQPLRAEIDLTSVSRDEAGSLAARLASPAAYRQAGVEYNTALMNVRMAVDRRADGQYFIRLTSIQPVNDPIVDALVELTWANGRLLREYTFLLDPVDMKPAPQPSPPVAAPLVAPPPAAPVEQAPPAPPPVATPAPVRPTAQPVVQPKPAGVTGSYEVKKGDTLGKIARQAQSDGVTLDQMLVALQRANQDAFIGGNVNRLKSGVILSIPDKEAAASVAPSDARRLIAAQSADWRAYQEKIAGGVQTAPAQKPAATRQEAKGKITAKVEDKAASGAAADKLKLSKADPAAVGKDAAKGAAKPKIVEEDRISKERELRDAKARQAELERNVKDLQKIAELKNQSLADLQKSAQAKGAPPVAAQAPAVAPLAPPVAAPAKAPEAAKAATAAPVPAAPVPAVPPVAVAKAPEPAKAAEPPKAAEPAKAAEPPKVSDPAKALETAKALEAPKGADAPKADASKVDAPKVDAPKVDAKPAPKKAAPPPPPPEPSVVDEFLGNPLYLGAAGGVLAALGGYAAFAVRRKRKEATTGIGNSNIISGGDLKANSVFGNTGGQSIDTGNSSFQSDFSTPGSSAAESDEVDPVAEADVYMAYGRDAQAEEILKEALVKDPSRQTVRLKLLEIYNQRGDANSFGTTANELHAATGGQGEQWTRAAALGQQLDPSNALYGGGAAAASASDKTMTMPAYGGAPAAADAPLVKTVALNALQSNAPAGSIDLDFDLGGDAPAAPAQPDFTLDATSASKPAPSIDFDLGFGDDAPAKAAAPVTDFAPSGTLIIDAPPESGKELASGVKTVVMSGLSVTAPAASDGNSVDFDFDIGSSAPAAPAPAAAPVVPAGNSVDFDFGSISLDLPATAGAAQAAPADDVATKLDLAKAYQEMGDKDGAKELLKEVAAEGSAAQKAEAQKLLTVLG